MRAIWLGALLAVTAGCSSTKSTQEGTAAGATYRMKAHEFEGCECDSVCPCLFSKNTSYGDCKVLMGWTVTDGHYKGTDLSGVMFAVAITKSGANMEKELGKWTGVLYLSDKASEGQKAGVTAIMKAELGAAFSKLDVKTARVGIKREGDRHELTVGDVGALRIAGLKNAAGHVTCIENAPSPLATSKIYCALSELNTYNDGVTKWDLKGRNALYTKFNFVSKN